MIISSIIMGFILGFNKWGIGSEVIIEIGLINWLRYFIIAFVVLVFYKSLEKIVAIITGNVAVYKANPKNHIAGVLLAIISLGKIPLLSPGSVILNPVKELKMHKWKRTIRYQDIAKTLAIPAWISVLLAAILNPLTTLAEPFKSFMHMLLMVTAYSLLPIPGEDGFALLISSKVAYVVTAVSVILLTIVALTTGLALVIPSLIIGIIFAIIFFKYIEPRL